MALRLIEIICRESSADVVAKVVEAHEPLGEWLETLDDGRRRTRVLLETHEAEAILDELDGLLGSTDLEFRAILLPVEATLPRADADKPKKKVRRGPDRISREELYADLRDGTVVSFTFIAHVVLSAVVAAIGLVRNDVAILIGAMVIAPLLTPNASLTMGAVLGDWAYMAKALRVNLVRVSLALALAVIMGLLFKVDPTLPSITARASVSLPDVALALAAGSAGALAFTTGAPSSLIGVMVAVALMPPLVACGLLLASGQFRLALGAAELVAVNVISVNLAGMLTFVAQGVSPRTWWEKQRAQRAVRVALSLWLLALAALIVIILWSKPAEAAVRL